MDYFKDCQTVAEIKAEYKKLAREHHPDLGGDLEVMKDLNNQYEQALKAVDGQKSTGSDKKVRTYCYNGPVEAELMDIIFKLNALDMEGVDVDLIGVWIWITGDTRPHKDGIKATGCKWNSTRKCWFYKPKDSVRYYRSTGSLEDLAKQYGAVDCSNFKKKSLV